MLKNSAAILIRMSKRPNNNCPNAILLNKKEVCIGRRGDVKMDTSKMKEVSKYHARITRCIEHCHYFFVIDDLHSVNGTFVNRRKIIRDELAHKDEIVFAGGNQYLMGDQLNNVDNLDCVYRFVLPETEVNFANCQDFDNEFEIDEENIVCCVCFAHYHRIVKLECGHHICVRCLAKWSRSCFESLKTLKCPTCRHKLVHQEIKQDSAEVINGVQHFHSIEPLCKTLNIKRIDEVTKLSIRKPWTIQEREQFWKFNEIVSDSHNLKYGFHWLTECSIQHVLKFNDDELRTLIENIEYRPCTLQDSLLEEALYLVTTKIMKFDQ